MPLAQRDDLAVRHDDGRGPEPRRTPSLLGRPARIELSSRRTPNKRAGRTRSGEGAHSGDIAPDDQRLHGLGALVGVDYLDVDAGSAT